MFIQLMKIEDLETFLLTDPDPHDLNQYMDYVAYWSDQLKNGGMNFSEETRKRIMKHLARRIKPQP